VKIACVTRADFRPAKIPGHVMDKMTA